MRALLVSPEVRFVEEVDYGGTPTALFDLLGLQRFFAQPSPSEAWSDDHLRRLMQHNTTGDLLYVGIGGGPGTWEFAPHGARFLRGRGALVGGWMPGYKMWSNPRMRLDDFRGMITWRN